MTRADEADAGAVDRLAAAFPDLAVVPVSVLDEASLDAFRAAVWALTGLIRVRLRKDGSVDPEPLALEPGATVADVADWVHHDLGGQRSAARGSGDRRRGSTASASVASTRSSTATSSRSCAEPGRPARPAHPGGMLWFRRKTLSGS